MNLPLAVGVALVPLTALVALSFANAQRRIRVGQHIREEGPRAHHSKRGTPTMGGAVILALWGVSLLGLELASHVPRQTWAVYVSALVFGLIGLSDDLVSLLRRRSRGLSVGQKLLLGVAAATALFFAFGNVFRGAVLLPFTSHHVFLPVAASAALAVAVFLATTNSMNLTDGLDGLATGVTLIVGIALWIGRPSAETELALLPFLGALAGFLWVNTYPARLFLGDVGAFALGGAVAALALADGLALVLPLLAGVVVLEAVSVILQVVIYRTTGRRLLRMSPLHHHFEFSPGLTREHLLPAMTLPEPAITMRLWLLQAVFAGIALLAMAA